MRWLDRLAMQSASRASRRLSPTAWPQAYDAARRGDYAAALAIWGPLAQAGVARAQNNIGACFRRRARRRARSGAGPALADPRGGGRRSGRPAQSCAALYFKGEGVEQDYARAAELYRAAAEAGRRAGAGHAELDAARRRQHRAATTVEARRWAVAAADQGIAAAMTRLGMIYHNALGVERDASDGGGVVAATAAERGDADGQAMLGAALSSRRWRAARSGRGACLALAGARRRQRARRAVSPRPARGARRAEQIARSRTPCRRAAAGAGAMIIGTAGHIDHGKTALVRALTGVDTDRLKEEKARGISIDLGFAYLPAPDGSVLGFVDVPGHEKFVHNMLAGATGIDFVLLVVAADDGVMPQTREHLAIVDLLGIERGIVALTKADLAGAGAARRGDGRDRAVALTAPDSPVRKFCRSPTVTGEGIDDLRERLFDAARTIQRAQRSRRASAWRSTAPSRSPAPARS